MRHEVMTGVVGSIVVALGVHAVSKTPTFREKTQIINAAIWTVALSGWPLLWRRLVGSDVASQSVAWIGLMWPIAVIALDMSLIGTHSDAVQSKRNLLNMDSNTICSLTFAMAGILASKQDKTRECCTSLFMYAIVGCLVFVLPSSHGASDAPAVAAFEAFQRVSLTFSTALLIAGAVHMNVCDDA